MENRIIKFRAWCRDGDWEQPDEDKRMFVMIDADSLSSSTTFGLLKDSLKDIDDEIYFMQFTGLKDKNGKDIYTGDIIKFQIHNYGSKGSTKYIEEVRFEEGCFVTDEAVPLYVNNVDSEVIGNIYENPELLKQK